jgi:hypothetical protein
VLIPWLLRQLCGLYWLPRKFPNFHAIGAMPLFRSGLTGDHQRQECEVASQCPPLLRRLFLLGFHRMPHSASKREFASSLIPKVGARIDRVSNAPRELFCHLGEIGMTFSVRIVIAQPRGIMENTFHIHVDEARPFLRTFLKHQAQPIC